MVDTTTTAWTREQRDTVILPSKQEWRGLSWLCFEVLLLCQLQVLFFGQRGSPHFKMQLPLGYFYIGPPPPPPDRISLQLPRIIDNLYGSRLEAGIHEEIRSCEHAHVEGFEGLKEKLKAAVQDIEEMAKANITDRFEPGIKDYVSLENYWRWRCFDTSGRVHLIENIVVQ